MNVHKHMEAIFVVTLAVIGFGTMALDGMPEATAGAPVVRADVAATPAATTAPVMCAAVSPRRA